MDGVGGVRVCTARKGGLAEGGSLSLLPEVSGGKPCCLSGGLSADRGSGLLRRIEQIMSPPREQEQVEQEPPF